MAAVQFDPHWQYNGCRVLRMESDLLRIEVMPEVGGRIWSLYHKAEDREYLWHHPRILPAILPTGTGYDDHFAGGWDDLFPSDSRGEHEAEVFPDHGEYWTTRFDWRLERAGDAATLYLCAEGPVTPTRMERWITLETGSTALRVRHRLTHLGDYAFNYLWKQHPAICVGPTHEILAPGGPGLIAVPGCGRLSADCPDFTWPHAPARDGSTVDLSRVPATTGVPGWEMVYLTAIPAGSCGVFDRATGTGLRFDFDPKLFTNLWIFQSLGGWRGVNNLVVLEPSTTYPYDLNEAARTGHIARLHPGQVVETQVTATVFTQRE